MKILQPISAIVIAFISMTACVSPSQKTAPSHIEAEMSADTITYEIARNYFVRNDVDSVPTIIGSKEEFEKYFGMAAVMGPNGTPTEIDFSKNSVIAVVLPETDLETKIRPESMEAADNGKIIFLCDVTTGTKLTYTTRPMLIAIVSKEAAPLIAVRLKTKN